jgi:hypothetical protein
LKGLTIDPKNYDSIHAFAVDWMLLNYCRKGKWFKTSIDTEQVALTAEASQEALMASINNRSFHLMPFIEQARRFINLVVGSSPGAFLMKSNFGPGATFDIEGGVSPGRKLRSPSLTVTRFCLPYARAALSSDYHWHRMRGIESEGPISLLEREFQLVDGNRLTTVEKDAFVDRCIAIEPTLNIYVQKGLGAVLRQRLKSYGCDLDDQTLNQQLALEGSVTGELCTIDLSSASDSISKRLVQVLMPPRWYEALNSTRSTCTRLADKSWRLNEKFSSMGNGFTFELESLIFLAICRSASRYPERVSVYGDDIICHKDDFASVIDALSQAGFTANLKKTFADGPFRESCGKHYFLGEDVTPIYQKEVVYGYLEKGTNNQHEYYSCCNRIIRWMRRLYGDAFCGDDPCGVGSKALRFLTRAPLVHRIPDGYGDGGLLSKYYPFDMIGGIKRVRMLVNRAKAVYDPETGYWKALIAPSDWTRGRVSIRGDMDYKSGRLLGVP